MTPSWLSAETARLAAARQAGRMPHALLIHEPPGAGGEWLALWCAQLLLCTQADKAPCGVCASCRRVLAGQHPDITMLQLVEESQQIRIEQVRELAEGLALTSHQGSYKVAVVSPADALNRFAANALLKTLEEPAPRTLLILVATQPSRLPPTILSRCQRMRVRAPTRAEALAWLQETRGPGDWGAVLDVLGEAPMSAAEAEARTVVQIGRETAQSLDEAVAGTADPVATAEKWARADVPLRLRCIETWLTERIRERVPGGTLLTEVRAGTHLPARAPDLNIQELFEVLDGVRELKSSLEAPLNRGLAFESLLRRLATRGRPQTSSRGAH